MTRFRLPTLAWLSSFALLLYALTPARPAVSETAVTLKASAPLGTVVTVTLTLTNTGQPATTVYLYEAWPAGPAAPARSTAPLRVPLPADPDFLITQLRQALAPAGRADILVYLADQADLSPALALTDWNARGEAVYQILTQHAARTQAPLLAELTQRGYTPRSYWIVNALLVQGDSALAAYLAARPEVALLAPNIHHPLTSISPSPDDALGFGRQGTIAPVAQRSGGGAGGGVPWGLTQIRAPQVWADYGLRGQNIVVANIDTGVAYTHTALFSTYRGYSALGFDHNYNWFNPHPVFTLPVTLAPFDTVGHGTHTLGIMAGGAVENYAALGVAPAAQWIAALGCASSFCSDEDLLASAEWILAPTGLTGANPRPDLRPHIINNSWGEAGDRLWYLGYVTAWNAAGIFAAFANGNDGLLFGCGSAGNPGNYAASFAVGATDPDDFIASFSSRGPTSDNRLKPDLSAPGVNVVSADSKGGTIEHSGTSMATPHVAGAVALLWSANPLLIGDIVTTRNILTRTTIPRPSSECGSAGVPNNTYGWGRLDAYRAVQAARVEVPWLAAPASLFLPANAGAALSVNFDARQVTTAGAYTARLLIVRDQVITPVNVAFDVQPAVMGLAELRGQLTDLWTDTPIFAHADLLEPPSIYPDPRGYFTLTLPVGTHALTLAAPGYLTRTAQISLTTDLTQTFPLTPDAPHFNLATSATLTASLPFGARADFPLTVRNAGTQPLTLSVTTPALEWSLSESASANLYDLSAFSPLSLTDDLIYTEPLQLGFDFPFYGQLVNQLYLSSNGWVSVAKPKDPAPLAGCFPSTRLPTGGVLAPFWTDLDPSQGGIVRAGSVSSATYVISFENVPPWQENPEPNPPTYTFQLAFHADGRAEFIYGLLGATPWSWGVGAMFTSERYQTIACERQPKELPGRTLTLRAQPSPTLWLSASPAAQTLLPGASAPLTVSLIGAAYVPWRTVPYTGTVRLSTNDPTQPQLDWPVALRVGPPAAQMWLPVISR